MPFVAVSGLVWCIAGSPSSELFFVELGAEMMAASTMLPSRSVSPFFILL